jgi:Leucine-rich repeat (LRR) protein
MNIKLSIDLSNINENILISKNIRFLELNNVTEETFHNFIIPKHVTEIELTGICNKLVIPDHIEVITCGYMQISELICNDNLKQLYCYDNNIEKIILPDGIVSVLLNDNKLIEITAKNKLHSIEFLDLRNNYLEDFVLELPPTLGHFDIKGNKNFKLKYSEFIVARSQLCNNIDGDYDEILFKGRLRFNEHLRCRLRYLNKKKHTYITLEQLEDDSNFEFDSE